VELRPATEHDRALLLRLYAGTRADELASLPWPEEAKRAFVEQQFSAQDAYYREHYPVASFDVIVADGTDVGRLYVDRREDEIRIIDIAVLPEARGRGIGTALLRALIDESEGAGKPLTIHVEGQNPARAWYERLGFVPVGEAGAYARMERAAGGVS
jgi:ribosomal protein S18 acetylase RimI-like enzyme